jgi:hypothetical protein
MMKNIMARLTPKKDVVRALFARSGNQCAFPGCVHQLINKKNQFIAQICHIESAMPGGERYNEKQSDEQRRSYENLIILCYSHHIETNDVDEYTVEKLKKIKLNHETLFEKDDFKIDETELVKLISEMDKYWIEIERLNKIDHTIEELAMKVNAKSSFCDLIDNANNATIRIENLFKILHKSDRKLLDDLYTLLELKGINKSIIYNVPYYENPFENRNWETHNLGVPNWLLRLRIDLVHIEVKYLEEYLKTNSNDLKAKDRFEKIKLTLADLAQNAAHVD